MSGDFSIEVVMSNEINPLDAVVRAMNVVRRSKVTVRSIFIDMDDSVIRVSMRVRGEEDEIRWVCNKLDKLYDTVNVKYTPIELQSNIVVMNDG